MSPGREEKSVGTEQTFFDTVSDRDHARRVLLDGEGLTPEDVAVYKSRCARAARELSFEHEAATIREIIDELSPH